LLHAAERDRIAAYVVMTCVSERRWFAGAIRTPVDELLIRYFARRAWVQEELAYRIGIIKRDGK
jgi:hypothetical protein